MNHWVVSGGGFRGIMGAHFLAEAGNKVTVVEDNPYLGGILYSSQWEGLYLDKGCHLFDNVDDEESEVMHAILEDDVIPIQVKYASVIEGTKSDGMAVPDFTVLDSATQSNILSQVIAAATQSQKENGTLADLLESRYGPTLLEYLSAASLKMFGLAPDELDASAYSSTLFKRLRIVNDDMALLLKESPALDERIAASSQDDPLKFYRGKATRYPYRNYYPNGKGMRSFCEKASCHLLRMGVSLTFGDRIESISCNENYLNLSFSGGQVLNADRFLWTRDVGELSQVMFGEDSLRDLVHNVPMLLYYFLCPPEQISNYTYIHDFSEDSLIFRASTAGMYGHQSNADGKTYVCFEVPTSKESPQWNQPDAYLEAIWGEALSLGVVFGKQPQAHTVLHAPVTYRMPKPGFSIAHDQIVAQIRSADVGNRIVLTESASFSKSDITANIKEISRTS